MILKDVSAFQKGEQNGLIISDSGGVHPRVFHLEKKTGGLLPR